MMKSRTLACVAAVAGFLAFGAPGSDASRAAIPQGSPARPVPGAPQRAGPAVHELLDAYWAGDYDIVQRRFTRGRDVAEMLPRVRAWVESSAARGWQFASVVLLLELADAAARLPDASPETAVQLVVLARREMLARGSRGQEPIDRAVDVLWHQTALALLQAQRAWTAEQEHLGAIERHFEPDIPTRFWMARAIALEQRHAGAALLPDGAAAPGKPTAAVSAMEEALRDYDRAARDAAARTEASARAAALCVRMGRHRDALRRLDLAGDASGDLLLASWLPFLRGQALAGIGEHTRAVTAFDQALQLNPASVPARLALASTLRSSGRAAEADVVDARPNPSPEQPWAVFELGDARFASEWLARLKGSLAATMKSKAGTPARPPVLVVLDRYEAGDYDFAVNGLVDSDLRTFVDAFREAADRWIAEGDPAAADHRRLVVATVALEAARARGFIEWPRAQLLLEWACERLRAGPAPTDAERRWMEAAAVVMEGAVAGTALDIHATHALKRFPDDPALVMARAVSAELRAGPDDRTMGGTRAPASSALDTAVTRFKQAASLPAYRDEANLRLGYTALRRSKFADALAPLEIASANTDDAFIRYLAQLFRGRALERLSRWDEAVRAYRAAVAIQPKAQTAELALAASLARAGQQREAAVLAEQLLGRQDAVFDPWLAYGQGDFRHWPRVISALRSAIK